MVETFIGELEAAVETQVKLRLREALQSLHAGDGNGKTRGQAVAELRAAFGLPPLSGTQPALASAARIAVEPARARPGRCVGVITGGRRCGRAAPPGDPPLCSFCRATQALVNGATARVQITLSAPADAEAARPARIQISAPGPTIDPALVAAARKERCKGVLLGGGSCRSRVMPPEELCPWCRALGVRTTGDEAEHPVVEPTAAVVSTRV
ncbi:MAG TPA: hypothetical protein VN914_17230 [Polyangia bacterium]|nr:hypothetical protein [Polyangia bacterium]